MDLVVLEQFIVQLPEGTTEKMSHILKDTRQNPESHKGPCKVSEEQLQHCSVLPLFLLCMTQDTQNKEETTYVLV